MAGKGPAPKAPGTKARRNIDPIATTIIEDKGVTYGPELPADYAWHTQTLAWWETWRTAPTSQIFTSTDWDFLLDTALLHTQLWKGENVAAEIRLRVCKMGATPEDRQRLRLQLGTTNEPALAESKALNNSRKLRLLKSVGGNDGIKEITAV